MNVGFASQRYYDVTNTEKKQLAFGAKAPTIDVLEVATNLVLKTDRSYDTEKSLITKMTGRKFNGFERPEIRRQCMGVLTEKIPVLRSSFPFLKLRWFSSLFNLSCCSLVSSRRDMIFVITLFKNVTYICAIIISDKKPWHTQRPIFLTPT